MKTNFVIKVIGGISVITCLIVLLILIWNPSIYMLQVFGTNIIAIILLKLSDNATEDTLF